MNIFSRRNLTAVLLSTSALAGCGGPSPAEKELKQYILSQIDHSLADTSWQERHAAGSFIFREMRDHNKTDTNALLMSGDVEKMIAYNNQAVRLQREWDQHYTPLKAAAQAQVDQYRKQLGIKPAISVRNIPNSEVNAEAVLSDNGKISVEVTNTALDILTDKEMNYFIGHEVAGHIRHQYLDSNGHPLTVSKVRRFEDAASQAGIRPDHYREFLADKAFVDTTCDPDAATRAHIKMEASDRKMGLRDFRTQYDDDRLKKTLTYDNHPDWIDRIKHMREEAKKSCPQKD